MLMKFFRVDQLKTHKKHTIADAVIGAEIKDIDISKLDSDTFSEIEELFNERSVLCLRGQNVTEQEYIAFAKRFGNVEELFLKNFAHESYPEILLVSNIKENGQDIGHADAGSVWLTDGSYRERPLRASLLYALEVPVRNGIVLGDTTFASAAAAYDSLSDKMKNKIEGLNVVHDVLGRREKTGTSAQLNEARKKQPKVCHPFVRTHPFTGRKCLYVSSGECSGIEGRNDDEAVMLIDEMAETIIKERFQYTHKWQKGDILIWDNCALQHIASFDYNWHQERRLMWRITVS